MKTAFAKNKAPLRILLAALVVAVVIAEIVIGFTIGKSPGTTSNNGTTANLKNIKPALPCAHSRPASQDEGNRLADLGKEEATASPSASAKELTAKIQGFAAQFAFLRNKHVSTATKEFRSTTFRALAALRQALHDAPPDVAGLVTKAYLDSQNDALTGLDFCVGADGELHEAPSIRTALLDALAEIDPTASVTNAKQILAQSQSPEEWALALRNLARQNQDGLHTEELRQALEKMLDNQEWLRNPSAGFREALDVAAALGGPAEFQNMASVLHLEDSNGQPVHNPVSAVAFSALERMTINNPGQTVQQIDSDPAMLSWAPDERGALMARASMTDPAQCAAVERYLQRDDLKPEEITAFATTFPNSTRQQANTLISTRGTMMDSAHESVHADAVLAVVTQWQQDPRFQGRQAELQQISERLMEEIKASALSGVAAVSAFHTGFN